MNPTKKPTIVITGASSGIGAEFARYYGGLNRNLLLIARREEKLKALQSELVAQGATGDIQILRADLSQPDVAQKISRELKSRNLVAEILINNAAMALQTGFTDETAATWLSHLKLNILTFVDLTHSLMPDLKETQGKILNIGSGSSFQPLPYYAIYAASKAFMLSLSESLSVEMAPHGVSVTCVCPGAVRTDFNFNAGVGEEIGPSFIWMDARDVVRKAARALEKGKPVYIPGWINKLAAFAPRIFPRKLIAKASGRIYSKNLEKQKNKTGGYDESVAGNLE